MVSFYTTVKGTCLAVSHIHMKDFITAYTFEQQYGRVKGPEKKMAVHEESSGQNCSTKFLDNDMLANNDSRKCTSLYQIGANKKYRLVWHHKTSKVTQSSTIN